MEHPGFFERAAPVRLGDAGAEGRRRSSAPGADRRAAASTTCKPLADAGAGDVSFLDNRKYLPQLGGDAGRRLPRRARLRRPRAGGHGRAGDERALPRLRPGAAALLSRRHAPEGGAWRERGEPADPSDRAARGGRASSSPAPSIGREAQIGRGTTIAAGAVIGYRVTDRPRLLHRARRHASRMRWSATGSSSMPACASARTASASPWAPRATSRCRRSAASSSRTTSRSAPTAAIDRGALKDTIIGEGTKIDNLVQIGHNVVIGRHCVIVGQVGICRLGRARRFRGDGRPVGRRSATSRSARRADRRRLARQGRRAAGRAHGRHAGRAAHASGRAQLAAIKRLARRDGRPAAATDGRGMIGG